MSYEPFTREDWEKKPRSFTPSTYSSLMRKMVDPFTWGYIIPPRFTEKRQAYSTEQVNYCLRSKKTVKNGTKYVQVSRAAEIRSLAEQQHKHVTLPDVHLFYCMSPWSNISCAGWDIDPLKDGSTSQNHIDEAAAEIDDIFGGGTYIEPSTKGLGRHGYPIIDFTAYDGCPRDPSEDFEGVSFAQACNRILSKDPCSLEALIKLYINRKYPVNFDGIKGDYTDYRWVKFDGYERDCQWVDSPKPLYYLQRVYGGIILKQPKPRTEEAFFRFLNAPVLSVDDVRGIIEKLLSLLGYIPHDPSDIIPGGIIPGLSSRDIIPFLLPDISSSKLLSLKTPALAPGNDAPSEPVEPHTKAQSDLSPSGTNADCLVPDAEQADLPSAAANASCLDLHKAQPDLSPSRGIDTDCLHTRQGAFYYFPPLSLHNSLGPDGVKQRTSRPHNPFDRYRVTTQSLMRQLGRRPTFEEWTEYYEKTGWAAGAEKSSRRKKFEKVVEYVAQGFDPEKASSNYHRPGRYIEEAKRILPPEKLAEANAGNKAKVTYEDIDMGLGYVGFVLCDQGKGNIGTDNELTVCQNAIIDWVSRKIEEGETKRIMNRERARRVFQLLRDHGIIKLVSENIPPYWDGQGKTVANGRARRYVLTEKHPDFPRFDELYGDIIGKYRAPEAP